MWISKKKFQAALEDVKWKQVDYNVKMRHEERQNDRISKLESRIDLLDTVIHRHGIARIHKLEKKLKKYIKKGY